MENLGLPSLDSAETTPSASPPALSAPTDTVDNAACISPVRRFQMMNATTDDKQPAMGDKGAVVDELVKLKTKSTAGRKSTQNLKFIESYVNRMLTFNERRKTLFKKVYETAVTTGAECLLIVKYHRKSGSLCQYWGTSDILKQFESQGVQKEDDYSLSTDYTVVDSNADGYNKDITTPSGVAKADQMLQLNIPTSLLHDIASVGPNDSAVLTSQTSSGATANIGVTNRDNTYSLSIQSSQGALVENLDTHYSCDLEPDVNNTTKNVLNVPPYLTPQAPELVQESPQLLPQAEHFSMDRSNAPPPHLVPQAPLLHPQIPPFAPFSPAMTFPQQPAALAGPTPFVAMCDRCNKIHTGYEGDDQCGPDGEFVCAACLNVKPPESLLSNMNANDFEIPPEGTLITGQITPCGKNKGTKKVKPVKSSGSQLVMHSANPVVSAEADKRKKEQLMAFELDSEDEERARKEVTDDLIDFKEDFYSCTLCSKSFGRKSKAITHIRLVHEAYLDSKVEDERQRVRDQGHSTPNKSVKKQVIPKQSTPPQLSLPQHPPPPKLINYNQADCIPPQMAALTSVMDVDEPHEPGADAFMRLPKSKREQIALLGHAFTEHVDSSGKEVFACILCKARINHRSDIYKHTNSVHGINSFLIRKHTGWACKVCGKSQKTYKTRLAHLKSHDIDHETAVKMASEVHDRPIETSSKSPSTSAQDDNSNRVKANKDGNRRQCHMCGDWFHQCYVSFHRQWICRKSETYGEKQWNCTHCDFSTKVPLEITRHRDMHKKRRATERKKERIAAALASQTADQAANQGAYSSTTSMLLPVESSSKSDVTSDDVTRHDLKTEQADAATEEGATGSVVSREQSRSLSPVFPLPLATEDEVDDEHEVSSSMLLDTTCEADEETSMADERQISAMVTDMDTNISLQSGVKQECDDA